jgi:hypothetical protein
MNGSLMAGRARGGQPRPFVMQGDGRAELGRGALADNLCSAGVTPA